MNATIPAPTRADESEIARLRREIRAMADECRSDSEQFNAMAIAFGRDVAGEVALNAARTLANKADRLVIALGVDEVRS